MNVEEKYRGYIQMNRKELFNTPWYLNEKFSKQRAWEFLLYHANHKETGIVIEGFEIQVKRGQLCRSIKNLAEAWRWNRKKVRKFFEELKELGYADYERYPKKGFTITSVITILAFDRFVPKWNQDSGEKEKRDTGENFDNKGHMGDFSKIRDTGEIGKGDTDNNSFSFNEKEIYLDSNTNRKIGNRESRNYNYEQKKKNLEFFEEMHERSKNKKCFDPSTLEGRLNQKAYENSFLKIYEETKTDIKIEVI